MTMTTDQKPRSINNKPHTTCSNVKLTVSLEARHIVEDQDMNPAWTSPRKSKASCLLFSVFGTVFVRMESSSGVERRVHPQA